MPASTKDRLATWHSGFCGLRLPAESHARCSGGYGALTCACACHATTPDLVEAQAEPAPVTGSLDPLDVGGSLVEMPDLEQGSEAWHDQRRGLVTASVVGKLVSVRALTGIDYDCPECGVTAGLPCVGKVKRDGVYPSIKTLHQGRTETARESDGPPVLDVATGDDARGLTALLVAERITGYTDPTYVSDDMLRGVQDEPLAIDVYSEHFAPVTTSGFMVRTTDQGLRIGYSPDGLVGTDGLVEVKSRRQKKQLTTILDDEVPAENMAQLQCGLLVSGRAWIDYISYCGGMPLYRKRVTPDPRWFDVILAAVEAFEKNAADMVAAYQTATAGLPLTERALDFEMVI
jgi:hypothetical protein